MYHFHTKVLDFRSVAIYVTMLSPQEIKNPSMEIKMNNKSRQCRINGNTRNLDLEETKVPYERIGVQRKPWTCEPEKAEPELHTELLKGSTVCERQSRNTSTYQQWEHTRKSVCLHHGSESRMGERGTSGDESLF